MNIDLADFGQGISKIRETYPAPHSNFFKFENCTVEVRSSHSAISESLKSYFKEFVIFNPGKSDILITVHEDPSFILEREGGQIPYTIKMPDPGKNKIKEEYYNFDTGRIVRKRLTGMTFLFGAEENVAVGPCIRNLNQVVNFINNRFIEYKLCEGALLGHAAGVILKNKGLALAGFSGAGKSTLALHLMSKGATFVSNDRLMIEKNGQGIHMLGVAKLPRINPGTILNNPDLIRLLSEDEYDTYSSLSGDDLWELEYKYDVPIDECFGPERFTLASKVHTLVILNWGRGRGQMDVSVVDINTRKDLLPAFMKQVGLFFWEKTGCSKIDGTEANYIDFLSSCTIIELTGTPDFEMATDICIKFLENGCL